MTDTNAMSPAQQGTSPSAEGADILLDGSLQLLLSIEQLRTAELPPLDAELLQQFVTQVDKFAGLGGPVIWAILAVCLLLWTLIIERYWFIRLSFPRRARGYIDQWQQRSDRSSWAARKIREAMISQIHQQLHSLLPLIKTLIALCPMLGLLGTVTGMVAVFDVIAIEGNSDAQAMAQGVYRSTLPTMAGLVVALSGLYFSARLQQLADHRTDQLADRLMLS